MFSIHFRLFLSKLLLYNRRMPDWLDKTIGNVRIDKYLARGGMAEVYLGTHLTLERAVAVKVLHSYIEEEPDLLMRFQREAKVVAGLRHPNIVQIYDFNTINGHPYIVMEYLKGPPLATYLRNIHKQNGRIPVAQIARIFKTLTASLDYAHENGVIHRDIKPGNIMLHGKADEIPLDVPLSDDVEVILTDFGLVRIANTASQTASGLVSGTPAYMSPEQARGDQVDHRTDIYSLGIVLYEMLAGQVPFDADSTLSVIYKQINDPPPPIEGISPAVQDVIDRALAKDPENRYSSSRQMAADLLLAVGMAAESQAMVNAMPDDVSIKQSKTIVGPKPAERKTSRVGLGLFSVLVVAAVFFGAYRFFSNRPSSPVGTDIPISESSEPSSIPLPNESPGLPDSDGMVEISTGTYEVGSAPADDYHIAPTSILLNSFWMDKYQVTYEQYQDFLTATGTQSTDVEGEGIHPVRGVTWDQAVAYCSWVDKRLPTEAEWEVAGRGPGTNPPMYPWGNDPTDSGNVFELPDLDTYGVGTLPFNKSFAGVYDMVGNIWEWVGEPYASIPADAKILRGGRFGLPVLELSYRLTTTQDDERYVQFAGFRCAADQVR